VQQLADLGTSPLSNDYARSAESEDRFPLVAFVCERCLLVQVPVVVPADRLFGDYAYLSSYSDSWLEHVDAYSRAMTERLNLGPGSRVVEVGCNDGHLLKCFVRHGVPVLGIDPAANLTRIARGAGIETVTGFFGRTLALRLTAEGVHADLLVGNNVLPHVPDLNDFLTGLRLLLAPDGLLTLEFPHLLRLLTEGQFDTIYHEHFSYFSVLTVRKVLAAHGLTLVDVEELPTHGGSLRVHVRHEAEGAPISAAVERVAAEEERAGLTSLEIYRRFAASVNETRRSLVSFVVRVREAGAGVAGYGAPAKATTLLNYCDLGPELMEYTVDRNPLKQGRLIPGTRIPIHAPEWLEQTRPDYVVILAWNLRDEIARQLEYVRDWGGRLVIPVPRVEILS
jgi:predicted TPR repeat methyltransferase